MRHYPAASGLRSTRRTSSPKIPDRPGRLLHRARSLLFDRRAEEALDHCDKVVGLMPRMVEVLCVRAAALLDLGYPELALSHLDTAIDLDQSNGDLLVERCRAYVELGNLKDADQDLNTLFESYGDDPEILYLMGMVRELRGEDKEADGFYKKAVELDPGRYLMPFRVESSWLDEQAVSLVSELADEKQIKVGEIDVQIMLIPPGQLTEHSFHGIPPTVLGLLMGIPAIERKSKNDFSSLKFMVFQRNLERMVSSESEIKELLRTTIIHELTHFLEHGRQDSH